MSRLILVRHGQSMWNLVNKFSGWVDMPLTEQGIEEAEQTAKELSGMNIDVAYTSTLSRAQVTMQIILSRQSKIGIFQHLNAKDNGWIAKSREYTQDQIPVFDHSALNERYYGDLQGMDKDSARKKYGEQQVLEWRRGFVERPPSGESLRDVFNRVTPYFETKILPDLESGLDVIVCAHGNSLRSLIKYVEGFSDEDIINVEFPTGTSVIYKYGGNGSLVKEKFDLSFDRKVYWEKPS